MRSDLENRRRSVETVVKVGGAAFLEPDDLEPVAQAIAWASGKRRILVVPGGGSFADHVRETDRRFGLSDSATHWMAILAMEQAAFVLAERIPRGRLVTRLQSVRAAIDENRVPVFAPFRCLVSSDPLPHSWEVTSDSIAAWVAGELGARKLVLVKPSGVRRWSSANDDAIPDCVDGHFGQVVPEGIDWLVAPADDGLLASVLTGLSPI